MRRIQSATKQQFIVSLDVLAWHEFAAASWKVSVVAETARVLRGRSSTAASAQAINLPHLVTRTMQRLCPPRHGVESSTADETTDSLANSVLAERTPLEQDILRRYYVLGESPEQIKTNLRVSSRTIQQTIASARAAFRQKLQRSESA